MFLGETARQPPFTLSTSPDRTLTFLPICLLQNLIANSSLTISFVSGPMDLIHLCWSQSPKCSKTSWLLSELDYDLTRIPGNMFSNAVNLCIDSRHWHPPFLPPTIVSLNVNVCAWTMYKVLLLYNIVVSIGLSWSCQVGLQIEAIVHSTVPYTHTGFLWNGLAKNSILNQWPSESPQPMWREMAEEKILKKNPTDFCLFWNV